MPFTPDQIREHRKKLRQQGVCTRCHKNKARKGLAWCDECREYQKEFVLSQKRRGLCPACQAPVDHPERFYCINCSQASGYRAYMSQERKRLL